MSAASPALVQADAILSQVLDQLCAGCGRAIDGQRALLDLALVRLPFHPPCAEEAGKRLLLLAAACQQKETYGQGNSALLDSRPPGD